MTFVSAMLRVLLVFALLANGMAGALASPGRAVARDVPVAGCHEHAAMAHHAGTAGGMSTLHSHSGHCTPDRCPCACMPSLQGAASFVAWLPAVPNRSHVVPVATPARPDPALPHLIRPPIG